MLREAKTRQNSKNLKTCFNEESFHGVNGKSTPWFYFCNLSRNSHASFVLPGWHSIPRRAFIFIWAFYLECFVAELSRILEIEVNNKFTLLTIIILIYSPAGWPLFDIFAGFGLRIARLDAAPEE